MSLWETEIFRPLADANEELSHWTFRGVPTPETTARPAFCVAVSLFVVYIAGHNAQIVFGDVTYLSCTITSCQSNTPQAILGVALFGVFGHWSDCLRAQDVA